MIQDNSPLVKNQTLSTDQLFLMIDAFEFLQRCVNGTSICPERADGIPAIDNPRAFNRHTVEILASELPPWVRLRGLAWQRCGKIALFLKEGRESFQRDGSRIEWPTGQLIRDIDDDTSLTSSGLSDIVTLVNRVAAGKINETMLKGLSPLDPNEEYEPEAWLQSPTAP